MTGALKMFLPFNREETTSCLPAELKGMYPHCILLERLLGSLSELKDMWWNVRITTDLL